jgi:hypothetical protein
MLANKVFGILSGLVAIFVIAAGHKKRAGPRA